MNDSHESYTIVVLPQPTAKGYQFRIPKRMAKRLGVIGIGVGALLVMLGLHYVVMLGKLQQLQTLKAQSVTQQQELTRYNELVTDLKGQLDRLREFDVKLRVMTNLNPPPESGEPGIGGTETPEADGRQSKAMTELEASLIDLQAQAARQEASFASLTDGLRGRMAQWASTPSIWPVRGWLSSGFGKRLSPFTGTIVAHKGIDLAAYMGTPVITPADARVDTIGQDSGLGHHVVLDHGYGIKTLYGHLSKSYVRPGQRVRRGEVIAAVGNSGLSTGAHLHYEIHLNGRTVDPLRYIIN